MEFRFDLMLFSNLGNENSDAGLRVPNPLLWLEGFPTPCSG